MWSNERGGVANESRGVANGEAPCFLAGESSKYFFGRESSKYLSTGGGGEFSIHHIGHIHDIHYVHHIHLTHHINLRVLGVPNPA